MLERPAALGEVNFFGCHATETFFSFVGIGGVEVTGVASTDWVAATVGGVDEVAELAFAVFFAFVAIEVERT